MQESTGDNFLSEENTSFLCSWKRHVMIKQNLKILLIFIFHLLYRKQTYIVRFDCLT